MATRLGSCRGGVFAPGLRLPFLFSLNRTTERGHALPLTFVRKFVGQNAVAVRPGISLILDKFQIRTGQAFADRSTGKGRRLLGSCFVGNSRVGECLLRARCGRPSPCGLVAFALSESARPHAIDCPGTAPNQSPVSCTISRVIVLCRGF